MIGWQDRGAWTVNMIAIHRMAPADFLRMHLAMEVTIQILPPFASGWSLDSPCHTLLQDELRCGRPADSGDAMAKRRSFRD